MTTSPGPTDEPAPIEEWWPKLTTTSQQWLIDNNGDAVRPDIVAEIAAAGGPAPGDPWWATGDANGFVFPDEAVDWVEETANQEGD
ncbi:hypothetical protein AAHB33_06560 [Paenarthrobacter sp. S56]|uniref:hypothetical protein n=1 Tax=Paenarthrobacter sp. S56 TaxID=3138179 RepID=UPI00321B2C60